MKKADRLFYVNRHSCFLLQYHVHILFEAPPNERLTELANVLKTRSARITWKRYPRELKKNLLG